MARVHAEAFAVISASSAEVYAVFADYRNSHPDILPKEYFADYAVEQGGQGEGTVFRVKTRVYGTERAFHMAVTEPGRKLVETDTATGLTTSFTITPAQGGQAAQVTIASDWESAPGFAGLIERLTTPAIMRRIYFKQLGNLATYLQRQRT